MKTIFKSVLNVWNKDGMLLPLSQGFFGPLKETAGGKYSLKLSWNLSALQLKSFDSIFGKFSGLTVDDFHFRSS